MNRELIKDFYNSTRPPSSSPRRDSELKWVKDFFHDRSNRLKLFKAYLREPTFQQVITTLEGHANNRVISRGLAVRTANQVIQNYYQIVQKADQKTGGAVVRLIEKHLQKSKSLPGARAKKQATIAGILGIGAPEFSFGFKEPKENKLIEVSFAGGNGRVTVANLKAG